MSTSLSVRPSRLFVPAQTMRRFDPHFSERACCCSKERLRDSRHMHASNSTQHEKESIMLTRRTALMGAAVAALMADAPARAADDLKLPRQNVDLVAPPFVHAARTGDQGRAEDRRVQTDHTGEGSRHRRRRHQIPGDDVRRLDARSDDGGPRGRLRGAHAGQSRRPTPCRTTSTCIRRPAPWAAAR